MLPIPPAAAVDDTLPPSVPANPHWSDSAGVLTETISGNTTLQAAWNVSDDGVGGSGIGQYRVQLAESPDFAAVMIDRYTGTTAASHTFTAADGVTPSHSYYFRVAAVDVNGNQSAMSGPSNRVDVSDQSSGPEIAHQPVVTAYYGQTIPISLYATCESAGPCAARLFYRTTGSASIPEGAWQRVELTRTSALPRLNNTDAYEYTGSIPGWAVTTTGVDYYLEAEDTYAFGYYPGTPFLDTTYAVGVQGIHSYAHIQTITPPLLTHQPTAFAQADKPIALSLDAVCSTGNCTARMFFRTSTTAVSAEPLLALPNWPSVEMQAQPNPVDLGQAGKRSTYTATIPASYVDTRGVDYFFQVKDGYTEAYWPGTTHQGYLPMDGQRITYHHVHVLEAPRIVHAPVLASPYRANIPITATSNCPATRTCTAQLWYRTTTSGILDPAPAFTTTPMSVTVLAAAGDNNAISVSATIPGSVADTRGVDYFFSISDGTTTSWYPGTSHVDGYVPVEGTRVGYQHTRVLEPPHIAPVYVPAAPALQDLAIEADVTCATEHCDVTMHYTSQLGDELLVANDSVFVTKTMTDTGLVATTPAGRVNHYRAVIPAAAVTTRGIAYYIQAKDGYTRTYSPGTFYAGAYVVTDGTRLGCTDATASTDTTGDPDANTLMIDLNGSLSGCATQLGAHVVRVLEPPHVVHVPIAIADVGTPQTINAVSNCSTPRCKATLHWRSTYGEWQSVLMTTTRTGVGVLGVASVDQHTAVIPAVDVKPEGFQYWIDVHDGYVSDSTGTYSPVMRGSNVANYPPAVPDYPEPPDRSVVNTAPTQLSARYIDPEATPGSLDIELVDAAGAILASGNVPAASGGRGTLDIPDLGNGAYRWRARAHDSLGATSAWTNYWTLAVFDDGQCGRFVALWAPRVRDASFMDALRATDGYPAEILAEGYHAFDEPVKRALIDCLHEQLILDEPLPPDATAEDVAWMRDMLYKLIFDKANLPETFTDPYEPLVDNAVSTATGIPQTALDAVNNVSVPSLPAGLDSPLGVPVPRPQDLIPENLLDETDFPATITLPEAQSVVDQAVNATSIVPEATSTVQQAVDANRLPIPVVPLFAEAVKTVIQATTYRACYESPTKAPTCTDVIPLGTPVPVDVTGDGSLDVLMQLTPFTDLNNPVAVTAKFSAKRLLTSEKNGQALKAHVWVIYDVVVANKRLRTGFDGWHRGDGLSDNTDLVFTIKDPLALTEGNLISHYALTHTGAAPTWAMTVGWSTLVAPDNEVDPLQASIQLAPVPGSVSGDFEIRRTPAAGANEAESREMKITAASSVATKVDAIVAVTRTSRTPARQDAWRVIVDKLPTSAAVTIHQDEDATHQATHVVSDTNAVVPHVQVTRFNTPDITKPTTYAVLVGDFKDVPTHVDATIDQRSSAFTLGYTASSVMTQATAVDAKVANNVITRAVLAQANGVPTAVNLSAGGDSSSGIQATYSANATLPSLLVVFYDNRNSGTIVIGRATNIPTSVTASASIADRKLNLQANAPVGMIDIKASRGGSPVLVLGGDHAAVIVNGSAIGASAHITGLQSASLTLTSKLEAHTRISPGGQPFSALVYLNNTELGLVTVSNLPASIDLTANANTTAPSVVYRSSARINQLGFFYTDLTDGPTVAAALNGVPSSVDLTATLAAPAKLNYTANSSLDQLVVVASPDSALKINTATSPYLIGIVQSVPASIEATLDLGGGTYSWNASATTPLVIAAARGIGVPAGARVLIGATGVPAQFDGTVSMANKSFSFRGISGSIGRLVLMATNHDTLTTYLGYHVRGSFDERSGQWDVSAFLANVSSGSIAIQPDLKTYKASLGVNLGGSPLILDVNYVRSPGIRFSVVGIALNFPTWVQASVVNDNFTYSSDGNMTAAFWASAGWIAALDTIPAVPLFLGVSARDGECPTSSGCGGTVTDFCKDTKCFGFKAALYATGLPTALNFSWGAKTLNVTNYRPSPAPGSFDVYADFQHFVSTPFWAFARQTGIPSGVNIAINSIDFTKKDGPQPTHVSFNMNASQPMGELWGVGAAYRALNNQDVIGYFDITNSGDRLALNAYIGGKTEVHVTTSLAMPTNITLIGLTTINSQPAFGLAVLQQIPANFSLDMEIPGGKGVKVPSLGYSASDSTMDGFVYVDAALTFDMGPVKGGIERIFGGFTNLGSNTHVVADTDNKTVTATSSPGTTQLWFDGSLTADTGRETFDKEWVIDVPGPINAKVEVHGVWDLGPSRIDEAVVFVDGLHSAKLRWKFPVAFTIEGDYFDMGMYVNGVRIDIDEVSLRVVVRPEQSYLSGIKKEYSTPSIGGVLTRLDMHLLRNFEGIRAKFDLPGPAPCWALRSQPTPVARASSGYALVWSGSTQAYDLWLDPGGLIPDIVGDLADAAWLSNAPGHRVHVTGC
jgi:hypothetical protein